MLRVCCALSMSTVLAVTGSSSARDEKPDPAASPADRSSGDVHAGLLSCEAVIAEHVDVPADYETILEEMALRRT